MKELINEGIKTDSITLYIVVGISKLLEFATYCTLGLRAQALIPTCNAPIPQIRGRHCNVYTQVRRSPHVYTLSIKVQQEVRVHTKRGSHLYANIESTYTKSSQYDKHVHIPCFISQLSPKGNIQKRYTNAHEQDEDLVSKQQSLARGLEPFYPLTKESSV